MAVLATPDWRYPQMDQNASPRSRSSPANDAASHAQQQQGPPQQQQHHQQQQQQQQLLHQQQQQMLLAQHAQGSYTYPAQQQAQGGWTPSITATPFYPSFYQNHQQQPSPQQYPSQIPQQPPYYDPANAQLAQWAYQQMMFNAQHGFPAIPPQHLSPSQRPPNQPGTPDYFSQNQIAPLFNPFPSGTPPPHTIRGGAGDHNQGQGQNSQYPGYHPYRRPNRQQSQQPQPSTDTSDWRSQVPHPPYGRPDASGSSSSVNSSTSQRQRTNSNQSGHSSGHSSARGHASSGAVSTPSSTRNSPSPAASSSGSSAAPSPLRTPHHRTSSASSSTSTATTTSARPSGLTPSSPTTAASTSTTTATSSGSATPRLTRPSPLSQGNFTASEKRMSRDDIDLGTSHESQPTANMMRSGGLKGRLRRALSFNAAQTLREEEAAAAAAEEDDDESIKASALNGAGSSKLKGKAATPTIKVNPAVGKTDPTLPSPAGTSGDESASTAATVQTAKKKGRAASLFNSRLNASTDNISLSSTVSSASVMIRKLGAMGKLARRNSLAGITSLFKDKDKDKEGGDKDKKGKKKDKKGPFGAKGEASEASVSHVTAELDRMGSGADWTVGNEMNGLSPAAKLARQHTLKSNAEAAAKAKANQEAAAAAAATASAAAASSKANGAGVPTWDRNTATRQGSASPVKGGGGVRINEDGTRTLIEDDDEDSEDGHYRSGPQPQGNQSFHADGWDDDEDWDVDGDVDGDEDVTIRVGMEQRSSGEDDRYEFGGFQQQPPPSDVEPWAVDVRRSVERTRKPAKGILKYADSYDQQVYLAGHDNPNQRARSNSYNSPASGSELGPLARIPSPDPDHIDGLHRHGLHTPSQGSVDTTPPLLPPLSFDSTSPVTPTFSTAKDLPATPSAASSLSTGASSHHQNRSPSPAPGDRSSAIFQHPNFNSSAPALSTMGSATPTSPPTLTHRAATTPSKRLVFASNLSVYDTFSASVYDRRSEPATWSRLTPALAQRIKEELNSYKMEEMEVHAASRIHTQFFV
ncbi:hypothetical protein B0H34DRAFT_793017 [Crassisporium funariophilum]|nr:hypothetical protein B0H34DRAFT_803384 [Crassisporium funariophilum]KAF8168404.1 hypothetical protein B0H34DRAFT_793017 [Crassisporium funariophilum]